MSVNPSHFEEIAKYFKYFNPVNCYANIEMYDANNYATSIIKNSAGVNESTIKDDLIKFYEFLKGKKLFSSEEEKASLTNKMTKIRNFLQALLGMSTSTVGCIKYIGLELDMGQAKKDLFTDLGYVDINYDQLSKVISKITDEIEFTDSKGQIIKLGKFKVQLHLGLIGQGHESLRAVALTPNPAKPKPDCMHPHVRDNIICLGEGVVGVNEALKQGRILDMFDLVEAVLNTYNRHSPHVALDTWNYDKRCVACSAFTSEEDGYVCDCENVSCENCVKECSACSTERCISCFKGCSVCGNRFCIEGDCCKNQCDVCGNITCDKCWKDTKCKCGKSLCTSCLESGCECEMEEVVV